jgi:hypothetical protein
MGDFGGNTCQDPWRSSHKFRQAVEKQRRIRWGSKPELAGFNRTQGFTGDTEIDQGDAMATRPSYS